jgi:hypothetical protein
MGAPDKAKDAFREQGRSLRRSIGARVERRDASGVALQGSDQTD